MGRLTQTSSSSRGCRSRIFHGNASSRSSDSSVDSESGIDGGGSSRMRSRMSRGILVKSGRGSGRGKVGDNKTDESECTVSSVLLRKGLALRWLRSPFNLPGLGAIVQQVHLVYTTQQLLYTDSMAPTFLPLAAR